MANEVGCSDDVQALDWLKDQARIGNLRKALGVEREATLASRPAIFADLTRERSSAEDDEAIADVFM